MRLFFWFLRVSSFFAASLLSYPIYEQIGGWGIAVLILFLILGDEYLYRKLRQSKERSIVAAFPIVKELEEGNFVTVELKNGEILSEFIYVMMIEDEIMLSKKMKIEDLAELKKNTRYLKLSKVKSIKKELSLKTMYHELSGQFYLIQAFPPFGCRFIGHQEGRFLFFASQ